MILVETNTALIFSLQFLSDTGISFIHLFIRGRTEWSLVEKILQNAQDMCKCVSSSEKQM